MTRDDVLARYVAICTSYAGCGAQHDRQRFLDLVAPHGPDDARRFFATPRVPQDANSSCGVVAVGFARELFRALGLTVPEVEGPMGLDWWARFVALAKRHKCYFGAAPDRVQPGCLYHVALGQAQHWRSVVARDGNALRIVDGGAQDVAGYQLILGAKTSLEGTLDVISGKPVVEVVDVVGLAMALLGAPATNAGPSRSSETSGPADGLAPDPIAGISGVDLSDYQRDVDYVRAVRAGIKFAIVKACDGVGSPQKLFAKHVAGFMHEGAVAGSYLFLRVRHGRAQDTAQQAEELCRMHVAAKCDGPACIDVEADGVGQATALETLEAWGAAREVVRRELGRRPMAYGGPGHLGSSPHYANALDLANDPLWISDMEPSRSAPLVPKPWVDWTIWQHSGNSVAGAKYQPRVGIVPGIAGQCDRNVYRGTIAELRALGT